MHFSSKVMSSSCPLLAGQFSFLTKQGQSRAVVVRKPESALSLQVVQAIGAAEFRLLAQEQHTKGRAGLLLSGGLSPFCLCR